MINIYTDGSCHTQYRIGAWVALIFTGEEKVVLSGTETDTTHNRMELMAVIKAVEYMRLHFKQVPEINVFSDSQYVTDLPERSKKLYEKGFSTKKGTDIQNADLVQELLALMASMTINLTKVKAHQKKTETENPNIEADKLCRKMVREQVAGQRSLNTEE